MSHLLVSKIDMPFEDLEGFVDSDYRLAQNPGANMEYLKHAPNPSSKLTDLAHYHRIIEFKSFQSIMISTLRKLEVILVHLMNLMLSYKNMDGSHTELL